ncbi:MAG: hypothetical protein WCO68_10475 [Verrucomicrobiota bacterium]
MFHELAGESAGLVVGKILPFTQPYARSVAPGAFLEKSRCLLEQLPDVSAVVDQVHELDGHVPLFLHPLTLGGEFHSTFGFLLPAHARAAPPR